MTVSCNTNLVDSVQITTKPGELGRSGYLSTTIAHGNDGPLLLQLRDSVLLTLSPRACNKLALKYENVEGIKLGPDPRARSGEPNVDRPLRAICDDCRSARDEVANLQLSMNFLMNEKDTLASRMHLLEKKLDEEQNKNVHLRSYNETLRFDLSAVTTKTLELSIDKQMLEDEMEKILWKDNLASKSVPELDHTPSFITTGKRWRVPTADTIVLPCEVSNLDAIPDEADTRTGSIFLAATNLEILKSENPSPRKREKETESFDSTKNIEGSKLEEKIKSTDLSKMENEIGRDLKKVQRLVDEKAAKLDVAMNRKKVNKVAPLHYEEKKMALDKKAKYTVLKVPLSASQVRQEDLKKKSFAQNNGRKYGLKNEEVGSGKNKNSKCDSEARIRNAKDGKDVKAAKDTKDAKKNVEPNSNPPAGEKKNKPKKVQDTVEEKVTVKKAMDKRTGKIIEVRVNSVDDKNAKKVPKYTDAGLNKLRKWQRRGRIEPVDEEPEPEPKPIIEQAEPKKNRKEGTHVKPFSFEVKKEGTHVKPFSFEVRDQEYLKKKQMLAKMGEQRKYEMKKWARSPEILKKKPFSVVYEKRYIRPDLYFKLKTEERIKKRPKFDAIVEEKLKSLREQQLLKHMAEVKELRKSQIHSPTPIPDNIMRLLDDAKKAKSDVSSEVSDSDGDLFSDLEYTDIEDHYSDAESPRMPDKSEDSPKPADGLKPMPAIAGESTVESNLGVLCENTSSVESSDEKKPMLSSEEDEAEKCAEAELNDVETQANQNDSNDAPSSTEPSTKLTPYNILFAAFKKKYSS